MRWTCTLFTLYPTNPQLKDSRPASTLQDVSQKADSPQAYFVKLFYRNTKSFAQSPQKQDSSTPKSCIFHCMKETIFILLVTK